MSAQLTNPAKVTKRVGIGKLRARKKELKAQLRSLAGNTSTCPESETFDREKEICRELAEIIPLIRTHNARKRVPGVVADIAATTGEPADMKLRSDPFSGLPVGITCCVTNCESDCITNCTSGCTLSCESDCRTGCTSGCTFGNNGEKTGSYIVTPVISAEGKRELQQVPAGQVTIEWN